MDENLLSGCMLLLLAACAASFLPPLRPLRPALVVSALASALALAAAIHVIGTGEAATVTLWDPSPYATLELRLDPLGAVFAAIVGGVGLACSVFGISYARHRLIDDLVYPPFLLTLLLVTCAGNVYTFLAAWEGMALTSFILVLGDGAPRPRRQAAILYLVMTHVATAFVAASFFIVAKESNSTEFAGMDGSALPVPLASAAFLFTVAGFGTKAGLIPLHIWLPRAHPVAPSHVSALMSGAMVKTGLYGIARVGLVFLGPGEPWWGMVLMSVGAASAVLGVLYALMERDMKRILAYSTVENVGIIAVGLGAAVALRAEGRDALAGAALTAALLHATNHAWFKTLLFLSAGSIQRAAHTLNIDRLGGLARALPATGAATLAGSLAIAALPPFNGFASEWILLRTLIGAGGAGGDDGVRLASLIAVGALALASGLAVACFVRMFGIAFLGVGRTPEATAAREPAPIMAGVLSVLAIGCLATGVASAWMVRWLQSVPEAVMGAPAAHASDSARLALVGGGSFSPVVIAAALIALAPMPWLLARLVFGANRQTRGPVWSTGVAFQPLMQYSGTSFSKPLRLFFGRVLLPERQIEVVYHGASPLPRLVRYSGRVPALFEERLYLPLRALALWAAGRVRLIQSGSVQAYLLYMMAALAVLLVVAR
ncbi:MAG: hydrogenase 4 subunit B [Chloroflexi bacterium]|nr:hydrogenase 4 subunit B [Chloroflexota bacterium]